ncbi:uracil phosphoribosyltransferase [Marinobacter sp. ELB17]|nr:uracil phosphoribosyltransferase [Marinobacter sp. ELB17]
MAKGYRIWWFASGCRQQKVVGDFLRIGMVFAVYLLKRANAPEIRSDQINLDQIRPN